MLFIFDWDGTISNSTAKIVKCMQNAAFDIGIEMLESKTIQNIIGLGLPEAIRVLYPNENDAAREALRVGYSRHFFEADKVLPSPFFEGVMDTLENLKEQGHYLTVATGKSRKGFDRVLSNLKLDTFFDASRCADETASKPDPKMLNELLDEFCMEAKDATMVGDTEFDMAMARNIEMPRIAVSYGAHHIDRLRNYQPNLCIDRFSEILSWSLDN